MNIFSFYKSCLSVYYTTCSLLSDCSAEEIDGCVVNGDRGGEKTLSAQTIIKTIPLAQVVARQCDLYSRRFSFRFEICG